MKKYLEATEIVDNETSPEFIRAEITDKTDAEIAEIKQAIIDIMSGKKYRLSEHLCRHDERGKCDFNEI